MSPGALGWNHLEPHDAVRPLKTQSWNGVERADTKKQR